MSDPIILKLTAAGLDAVLDAESGGFKCQISHCKLSSARFNSVEEDSRTQLPNIIHECPIAAGGVSVQARTLRFAVNFDVDSEIEVGSMGVYTSTGVLFAIASVTSGNLFKVYPKITLLGAFGITLGAKLIQYVQVLTDPNGAIAQKLLMDHETAEDPHPQYANQIEFAQAQEQLRAIVQGVYHVGSWHGTDNIAYSPREALQNLFGYLTNWELRPHAPYGVLTEADPVMKLYDISGTGERKAYTTRIWKRLPDDFKATIVANKSWVFEGDEITYTIIADNVPDDTVVPYIFSGVGIAKNDISIPLEGNITFQDNQAQLKIKVKAWTDGGETYEDWDDGGEYPEKLLLSLKSAESNTAEVTIVAHTMGLSQHRSYAGESVTAAFFYAGIPVGEKIEWFVGAKTGIHTVTSEYGRIIESDVTKENSAIGMTVVFSTGKRISMNGVMAGSNQTKATIVNPVLPLNGNGRAKVTIYDREFVPPTQTEQNRDGGVYASWGLWDSDSILTENAISFENRNESGTGSARILSADLFARTISPNDSLGLSSAPSGAWLIYHVYQVNYKDYPNLSLGYKTVIGSVFCYKP